MYAIMQRNTHKYGHGETRNKKLIKRRNDITQGSKLGSLQNRLGKRKRKTKEKKNKLLQQGYSHSVTHPSINPAEQGLTS